MPLQLPFWSSFSCLQATQNNHALRLCILLQDSSCVQTVRSHLLQYILRLKANVFMTMFAEGAYVWTGMQPFFFVFFFSGCNRCMCCLACPCCIGCMVTPETCQTQETQIIACRLETTTAQCNFVYCCAKKQIRRSKKIRSATCGLLSYCNSCQLSFSTSCLKARSAPCGFCSCFSRSFTCGPCSELCCYWSCCCTAVCHLVLHQFHVSVNEMLLVANKHLHLGLLHAALAATSC